MMKYENQYYNKTNKSSCIIFTPPLFSDLYSGFLVLLTGKEIIMVLQIDNGPVFYKTDGCIDIL